MRALVQGVLLALALSGSARAQEAAPNLFQDGVDAYRRGAYDVADARWRALLEEPLEAELRARVAFDLGNAAYRQSERMQAIGWYTLAVRADPRHADAWHNLELVRSEAGLPPADRGDLRATLARLLAAPRPAEARLLGFGALALLLFCLALEARKGGALWRWLSAAALVLLLVALLPWAWQRLRPDPPLLFVVRQPTAELFSEPKPTLSPIGELAAGAEVERIDALPGWVRVATPSGERGWLKEDWLFDLGGGGAPVAR